MVERVCGTPPEQFRAVCEAWVGASGREKTGALVYSVGWTQHSVGAQYIRGGAIIQLLLGNIGRPGGGVFALRGRREHPGLDGHPDAVQPAAGLPADAQRTSTRTSRATWTPSAAAPRRATGRTRTPTWCRCSRSTSASTRRRRTTSGSTCCRGSAGTTERTARPWTWSTVEKIFGYFLLGQNPAVGSAHGKLQRLGMANLDWVVVRDLAMIESATFWKDAPEVETGEIVTEECRAEVFFFPAASHVEKEGTFTQTQRMVQWRDKACEPTGDQRSDLWFFYHLGRMIKERLARSTDPRDEPVQKLDWSYHVEEGPEGSAWPEPSAEDVLRRINGYEVATGKPVNGFLELKADGSTACGCWIYSGVYADGVNQAARRKPLGAGPVRLRVGLDVAREPPGALQPLLGGSRGQTVERAQEARLVGRGQGRVDRPRRAGLPDDHRARPRAAGGVDRARGPARRRRVHHAGRRQGVAVRAERRAGRAAARALRGPRVAGAQPALRPAVQPDRQGLRARGQPVEPEPAGRGRTDAFPFVLTTARLTEHHTAEG